MVKSEESFGVSVIIPCLNEESSVGQVVDAAQEGLGNLGLPGEVIVVDNGCTDGSAEIARRQGARVVVEEERGYGAALQTGFYQARYPIMVMGDADLTYDFTRLDVLARPIIENGADMVIGDRMNNILPGSMPKLHRHVGNPFFSIALRLLFLNNSVKDPNCGMRAITQKAYQRLKCVTTGMEFASEMVIRAIHCKLKIVERDIIYHPRKGESKLRSFKDGWRHLRFMVLHSPTMMLLVPGILTWVFCMSLILMFYINPQSVGPNRLAIPLCLTAGLLNIVSVQMITLGMMAKAWAHLSGLRDDRVIKWLYSWFSFEKVTFVGVGLFLAGVSLFAYAIFRILTQSTSPEDFFWPLFLSLLLFVNGFQISASAYMFSIMALPHHTANWERHHRPGIKNQ